MTKGQGLETNKHGLGMKFHPKDLEHAFLHLVLEFNDLCRRGTAAIHNSEGVFA